MGREVRVAELSTGEFVEALRFVVWREASDAWVFSRHVKKSFFCF